jgi:hypothetical protein
MEQTRQVGFYYQAKVTPERCWFFAAVLRAQEHMCFDRTLDKNSNVFEFFVPKGQVQEFESLMAYFAREGLVSSLTQLPNRFADPSAPLDLHNSSQEICI